MRYIFKNFQFDSDSLVLTHQEKVIEVRHNEAQVLKLLIENADKALSKDEILSLVWQGKIVSDQAVFQNISNLRSIFGKDAIKTFSKRGYQWQLAVETITDEQTSAAEQVAPLQTASIQSTNAKNSRLTPSIFVFFGIVVALVTLFLVQKLVPTDRVTVAYITSAENPVTLENTEKIEFIKLTDLSLERYEKAGILEYKKRSNEYPLLLAVDNRVFNQKLYSDFVLKGPYGEWQGKLAANDQLQLANQIVEHLTQPFIYSLVRERQSPETRLANLSLAHQQMPNDLIVLSNLINSYIRLREEDRAMVLAEKMVNNALAQQNVLYQGQAFIYQSTVLTNKSLLELSEYKLKQAIEPLTGVGAHKLLADVWNAQAWIDLSNRDYPAIKVSMLKSHDYAVQAKDIERELHALTYLSVLGNKLGQYDDKYYYLTQAENRMQAYDLPLYRFAKIAFHHAIYSDSRVAKEPHLKRVLEYAALTPDHWLAQSSRKQLMEHYIEQNRLEEAGALVSNLDADNAKNGYLYTILALAKGDKAAFLSSAQRTFELAQLSGDKTSSLDVALLLCTSPSSQENFDFYSQYIEENATSGWRRVNEQKLMAINL